MELQLVHSNTGIAKAAWMTATQGKSSTYSLLKPLQGKSEGLFMPVSPEFPLMQKVESS